MVVTNRPTYRQTYTHTHNVGPISHHSDIVFDRIVTNVGSAYDEDTGRFTAPVNGTYQFNVIIAAQGRQKVA